jgi:outer membrane protein OmpA-like peptidoglycan-associated protein/tetratricopeptide (TPR) repeat protein
MKNLYKIIALATLITTTLYLSAQTGKIKKGDKYFSEYSYNKAIEKYESLTQKTTEVNRNLAESYARIGDTEQAEFYYAEVVKAEDKNPKDIYRYSSILSMNGKHAESGKWMKKYAFIASSDSRANQYNANPDYYNLLKKDHEKFSIQNVAANSVQEDFGPSYYKDKVVFASSREGTVSIKRTWNGNELPFIDIYVATPNEENELTEIEQFHKKINKKYHEGPVSFNKDGNFMVFTRNNYKGRSEDGIVNLQLFSSKFVDQKWQKEQALPYNNNEYSVGHASLTSDGKTMYFASDMPGGKGGVDIYKTTIAEDGSWGEAQNLGDKINTEGNEMFPFIHADGELLFFASDGHLGLGGLDLFTVQLKENKFGKIENLGIPVNSTKDDFSLILDQEMKTGYFASNRTEGKGDDDIYSFKVLKPFSFGKTIKGIAKDTKGNILADSKIVLYDNDGNEIETVTTTENGAYLFSVDPDKEFNLKGNKEKYFEASNTASTKTDDDVVIADLILEKDPGLSLYAIVTDNKNKKPLEGVKLTIVDNMTGEKEEYITTVSGDYRRPLADKKLNDRGSYNLLLEKDGYFSKTITYNTEFTKPGQYNVHGKLDLGLDHEVKDLAKLIEINPINFDYNKYKIRPDAAKELDKIVEIMNKYQGMIIELGSHTDSRGSDAYNRKLSDKRAKASAAYIKKLITDPKRIYGKGYGEAKIINKCVNGVKCSEEEHEKNRRTEFKVINTGNDKVKVKNNSPDSF